MKLLFLDNKKIINSSNITIRHNILKRENIVITTDEEYGSIMNGYYTIIDINKKKYIYYRASYRINKNLGIINMNSRCSDWLNNTCLALSENGIDFTKKITNKDNNIIFYEKCVSHNFMIFMDKDNKIRGIGGLHADPRFHSKCFPQEKKIYYKEKNIVSPYISHPCRCNGLYLYSSTNGLDWKLDYDKPVISGIHQGQTDGRNGWGWSEFDGRICCLYSKIHQKYFLYCRSNIKNGIRSVQVTTSVDLLNWKPFQLLKFNPKLDITNKENYYVYDVSEDTDARIFYGFSPYNNKTEAYISLLYSNDGFHWNRVSKLLITPLSDRNGLYREGRSSYQNCFSYTN